VRLPPEFNDKYGRLRAARSGPDGALYVTTSDGSDDKLFRVTPALT
jgi:aldose sugar dehydrogenase